MSLIGTPPYHKFKGLRTNCDTCGHKLEDELHPHDLVVTGFIMTRNGKGDKTLCVCGCQKMDVIHHQQNHMHYKYPVLQPGMTGKWIQYAQGLLMECLGVSWGYGALVTFDASMFDKVREFQKQVALPDDGIIGMHTWRSLMDVAQSNRNDAAKRAREGKLRDDMKKSSVFTGEGVPDWFKDTFPPGTPWSEMKRGYDEYLRANSEPRFKGIRSGQSQFDVTIMIETPKKSWELVPDGQSGVAWGTDQPNVRATARAMIYTAFYGPDGYEKAKADDMAQTWFDVFAERIVAHLPMAGWDLTFDTVRQVIHLYEEEAAKDGTGPRPRNNTGSGRAAVG